MRLCQIYRYTRVIKDYAEKYSQLTYIQIQLQHWRGKR